MRVVKSQTWIGWKYTVKVRTLKITFAFVVLFCLGNLIYVISRHGTDGIVNNLLVTLAIIAFVGIKYHNLIAHHSMDVDE